LSDVPGGTFKFFFFLANGLRATTCGASGLSSLLPESGRQYSKFLASRKNYFSGKIFGARDAKKIRRRDEPEAPKTIRARSHGESAASTSS
jgi:hypothetical protein